MTKKKKKDKPIYFSDYFNIDKKKLDELGVFDPILNYDTRFFLEILLVKNHTNPIIKNSYNTFLKFFTTLLINLKKSKTKNDIYWKTATERTYFGEYRETCLGYSQSINRGKGLNFKKILVSAKEIIDDDNYNNPELFLSLPFFEERVGADKISDMFQHIIDEDICEYTEDILNKLNIKGNDVHLTTRKAFNLLKNPFSNQHIKLLPKNILTEIPIVEQNINNLLEDMSRHNKRLKRTLNNAVGDVWDKLTKDEKREKLYKELKSNKELFIAFTESFKHLNFECYDVDKDVIGYHQWLECSKLFQNFKPNIENIHEINDVLSLKKVAISFIKTFKSTIENNHIYKIFWTKYQNEYRHRREEFSQLVFYMSSLFWVENLKINVDVIKDKNIIQFQAKNINFNIHIKHANNSLKDEYIKILEDCVENQGNHLFTILNFEEKISEPLRTIRVIKNNKCEVFEIDIILKDENDLEIEVIEFNKDDYYIKEKSEAGKIGNKDYTILKNKVKELCIKLFNQKNIVSANQLLLEVKKIIEKDYHDLLETFKPYKIFKSDGGDWTKPTIYRWCLNEYKNFKSNKVDELV